MTTVRSRNLVLAAACIAGLAACAVRAPPKPDEVRKDALQGTEVRADLGQGR